MELATKVLVRIGRIGLLIIAVGAAFLIAQSSESISEPGVLLPAWFMLTCSLAVGFLTLYLGFRLNRWAVGFGIIPFGMLGYYYYLVAFVIDPSMSILRSDLVRPALLLLYVWVPVLILNGRVNDLLTRLSHRVEQWKIFKLF